MKDKSIDKITIGTTRSDYFKLLEKVSKPIKTDKEKKPDKEEDET